MPADRFCRLAPLLPAYGGAVAARQALRAREQETAERSPLVPVPVRVPDAPAPTDQPVRPIEIQLSDNADLFSFGTSGG